MLRGWSAGQNFRCSELLKVWSACKVNLLLGIPAQDQMVLGFTRLLASVEDLALDFPDAAHTLSLFLGRTVVDEALPPSFLAAVLPSLRNDSLGVAVVHATGAALRAWTWPWLVKSSVLAQDSPSAG